MPGRISTNQISRCLFELKFWLPLAPSLPPYPVSDPETWIAEWDLPVHLFGNIRMLHSIYSPATDSLGMDKDPAPARLASFPEGFQLYGAVATLPYRVAPKLLLFATVALELARNRWRFGICLGCD